jgi:hypothetical protein
MVKLQAPKNGAAVHWRGKTYPIGRGGSVDVPEEAVEPLRAHGFVPWRRDDLPSERA